MLVQETIVPKFKWTKQSYMETSWIRLQKLYQFTNHQENQYLEITREDVPALLQAIRTVFGQDAMVQPANEPLQIILTELNPPPGFGESPMKNMGKWADVNEQLGNQS